MTVDEIAEHIHKLDKLIKIMFEGLSVIAVNTNAVDSSEIALETLRNFKNCAES